LYGILDPQNGACMCCVITGTKIDFKEINKKPYFALLKSEKKFLDRYPVST